MATPMQISELDFDQIKANIIAFHKSNPDSPFTDYNYEGSALSTQADLLAYMAHYMAFYANMMTNESFLDTAQKRASVVSRAKALGYVPHSCTSARAKVDITVLTQPVQSQVSLLRGSKFTASANGISHDFIVNDSYVVGPTSGNQYKFTNVELIEGTYRTYQFTKADQTIFPIPDANVDISTLRVRVQPSQSSQVTDTYNRATNLFGVDSESKVYFIQEGTTGKFELYFGDGILGKNPPVGAVIYIDYITGNLDVANGASVFKAGVPIGGSTNIVTITREIASGGGGKQSTESVRKLAPLSYAAQHRLVGPDDFKTFVLTNFPQEVEDANSWGGEDNDPPIYGKTFISIKPFAGVKASNEFKAKLQSMIKPLTMSQVVFSDPYYIYIGLVPSVKWKKSETFRTPEQLKSLIRNKIIDYFDNTLEKFGADFQYSQLTKAIDSIDPAIKSSSLTLKLRGDISPELGVSTPVTFKFQNKIVAGSFFTTVFYTSVDGVYTPVVVIDYDGNLVLLNFNDGKIVDSNYGTINYDTGEVKYDGMLVTDIVGNSFVVSQYCTPVSTDIDVPNNTFITLDRATASTVINRPEGFPEVTLIGV